MLNEAKANQTQFLLKLILSVSCRSRSNLGQTKNEHSEPTQNCHDSRNLNPMSDPTGWIANQHSIASIGRMSYDSPRPSRDHHEEDPRLHRS